MAELILLMCSVLLATLTAHYALEIEESNPAVSRKPAPLVERKQHCCCDIETALVAYSVLPWWSHVQGPTRSLENVDL